MAEEEGKGGKMPKLTIMEEVLLLGLKDKQVRLTHLLSSLHPWNRFSTWSDGGPNPQQFPCAALPARLLLVTVTLTSCLYFLGIPFILE